MLLIISFVQYIKRPSVVCHFVLIYDSGDGLLFSCLTFCHYPALRVYYPAVSGIIQSLVVSCPVARYEEALVLNRACPRQYIPCVMAHIRPVRNIYYCVVVVVIAQP